MMQKTARAYVLPVVCIFFLSLAGAPARGQPSGAQVVSGTATFDTHPGLLTVTQTSARAIITWQDFSLASGELARFIQPDATSATLNRVISGLPSTLHGRLEANGRLFLINPNGILVGAEARIDTAGFLASTLDVANADFLAGGDLHFTGGSTAAIRNLGAINALGGDVFLIARQVENTGKITAASGTAGLAAGSEVLLTTGGNERLFILAASATGAAGNSGTIMAATAELKAAGGNAYALAINNSGTVRATGSALRHGQVWLVATGSGTVSNAGAIDASSATGGGRILVLGSTQDGGRVTVGGTLDASSTEGDGGFIETSAARVQVTDEARVTTTAPQGRSGTWLIDPVDFTIAASGGDMTGAAVGTALAGGNFTIQSTTGGTGTAGAVNVNDAVSWSANKLTLNAQNNINFNANLNGSGTASLALEYGQGAVAAGNAAAYLVKAALSLPAGSNFSTKLGSDGAVKNFTVITSLGAAGSTTTTDLQGITGGLAGNYVLGADIDASATSGWNAGAGFAPIGVSAARYTGTFDGLGHTVSGLTIARPTQNDVGLFGYLGVGGVLRNIKLSGGSVIGMTGTGALLGNNSGSVSYASAATTVSGRNNVGGLIGASLGPIANVWATGNVSNTSGGTGFVGGLVGNSATGGTITNGWASGNVTATGPNAGGLVGFNTTAVLSNTYATGNVSGTTIVGGLVGSASGHINNSYATGSATGSGARVGGLVGHVYSGFTVTNSYATGSVSGTSLVGGLAGSSDGTVTNSYWDSTVTAIGMGSGTGATGRTTAEMKALASFTGFDISGTGGSSSVWRIYEGNTTPWLRVFLTPLTATANNDTKTYSGTAYSGGNGVTYSVASPSPTPSGSLAFGGTAQAALNAGTYVITASGLFSVQQGYDISYAAGTLTINPANLVLTGTRVYDGSTIFAGTNLTATGVNGESFTVGGAGAAGNLTTKNVQTSQALASVTGLSIGTGNTGAALASNYNSLSVTGSSVSVTPKALTITGFASDNKVYNGTTTAVITSTGTLTGVVSGDTVGFSQTGATFDTKDVGTGKTVTLNGVTLTGGDQANYTHTAAVTDLSDITAATLTYTATPASRLFGAANPTFSGTLTGFVNSETQATATTGTLTFTSPATVASVAGLYAINGSGLTANQGNYVFVQAPANATALTITAASSGTTPLTITADDKAKLYGAALPAFTASFAGFINGDTSASVTGLQFSTTATMGSNVGAYTITPFGATAPSTYLVGYVPGTLTINPALLNIFADNQSSIYGAALPAFTASFTGFVNGDTAARVTGLQLSSTARTGSNVGTYAITPSGATAANYSLAYHPGTLTISPAALTLTAVNAERPFGTANPPFSATTAGLVNGDTATVVSGLVFSTPATSTSVVGDYAITPSGGTAANYSLTYISGVLRVLAPTVLVGTTSETVITIDHLPVNTPEFAVIRQDDRLVLVSVANPNDDSGPLDGHLALALDDANNPPDLAGPAARPAFEPSGSANTLNFGSFEPVASAGGSGLAQAPEPGLFRESTVSMGGFNIVYHEAIDEARTQAESNTALGSSYREFSDSEHPQVNIVRAKADRKPAESSTAGNAPAL